jgi:hypothetical protein
MFLLFLDVDLPVQKLLHHKMVLMMSVHNMQLDYQWIDSLLVKQLLDMLDEMYERKVYVF